MTEEMVAIPCDCGFKLGIRAFDLPEIGAGVWGTIPCPKCKSRLNDKISKISDDMEKKPQNGNER